MTLQAMPHRLNWVLFVSFLCALAPRAESQISDQISAEDRARVAAIIERERERGRAQDPNAKPPPPDDPTEVDVAKRKRFGWYLGQQRMGFGCPLNIDSLKDADADIPQERKVDLINRWSAFLAYDIMPTSPELVRWYADWADYGKRDSAGKLELTLRLIVAEWSAGDIVVRAWQLVDVDSVVVLLLRFPKRPKLKFRSIPTDFYGTLSGWDPLMKTELRKIFVELFGLPFDSDADFRMYGGAGPCGGVEVFTGSFFWEREGAKTPKEQPRDAVDASRPPRPDRILITDSDPQYFCIRFDMSDRE